MEMESPTILERLWSFGAVESEVQGRLETVEGEASLRRREIKIKSGDWKKELRTNTSEDGVN